jgi:hypothetical protein
MFRQWHPSKESIANSGGMKSLRKRARMVLVGAAIIDVAIRATGLLL